MVVRGCAGARLCLHLPTYLPAYPPTKVLLAFFDAPSSGLAPAPGVREVTVDDPDGAASASTPQ